MWGSISRFVRDYRWTIVTILGCVAWNVFGWLSWHHHRTAAYAFEQVLLAIRNRDLEQFERYVDVVRVAEGFCDQHLLQSGAGDDDRAHCVTTTARRFRRWVTTRTIDEEQKPRLALLGSVLDQAFAGGKINVESMQAAGSSARAKVHILDRARRGATFELLLSQPAGDWRLVEVINVETIFKSLIECEEARISRLRKRIAVSVSFSTPQLQLGDPQRPNEKIFAIDFTSRDAAAIQWTLTCSAGSAPKNEQTEFRNHRKQRVTFACVCSDPCRPVIAIEELRLDDGRKFRVNGPMPLD